MKSVEFSITPESLENVKEVLHRLLLYFDLVTFISIIINNMKILGFFDTHREQRFQSF